MPPLPTELRKQLEKTVIEARDVAERGAAAALNVLAVKSNDLPVGFDVARREHRLALRARARALGEGSQDNGWKPLVEEVAYEYWHRMLFARFLAENGLLVHPGYGVAVTLQECAELAESEGEPDEWMVAAKYASAMLPGIFKRDDPSARVRFAANDRQALESLLGALPPVLFQSDDALGWVYQFWQTKAKKEVNASGRKVGGADLAPVTQLFTEHYMVRFLLENSLGAWWAARHPGSPLLKEWEYLRFRDDGTPAAGTFDGWPAIAKDITVMDPCCGSAHFLVAAADMLRKMRMEEEGLPEAEASAAVLRDNLFGLELDPRCTQIAAFALAFDAWKHTLKPPAAGGPPVLPNVACSGVAIQGQLSEWTRLAGDDVNLRMTLERLHEQFKDAPDLGSLINPVLTGAQDRMFLKSYGEVAPLVERALAEDGSDPAMAVFGDDAQGVARAAALLARRYVLVATNPPYLSRGKQDDTLKAFADAIHPEAKADLATMFIERCRAFTAGGCAYVMVTPQNWLFLGSYKKLRQRLLREQTLGHIARLGSGAFDTVGGEVVNVTLTLIENRRPGSKDEMTGLDGAAPKSGAGKASALQLGSIKVVEQARQLQNPDSVVTLEALADLPLLSAYANSYHGISTTDYARFGRKFWELEQLHRGWKYQQSTVIATAPFAGREQVLDWRSDGKAIRELRDSGTPVVITGLEAWERKGVAVTQMGDLPVTLHESAAFDDNTGVVLPRSDADLPAIWSFMSSEQYREAIRRFDQTLKVTYPTLVKIPFDLGHWQSVAERLYPSGLPEPHSDDPTQWLFKGNVAGSESPLQVAVARLLGYRWPDQHPDRDPGVEALEHLLDADGIVCLPAVAGEKEAAERLRALLVEAHANPPSGPRPRGAPGWPTLPASPNDWIDQLLAEAGSPGKSLDQWLRDDFFAQHIKLFQNRPFIWHVWDGLKDGFSALVNYHKLDRKTLEKLIFVHLNWWIDVQKRGVDNREVGADTRLVAATALKKKLELILDGEEPYDIYVRWKPPEDQAIGWEPDLDDGVRMNIRPFVTADVLRKRPNIKWEKDRGKNPDGSDRINDLHLSIAFKREARRNVGKL